MQDTSTWSHRAPLVYSPFRFFTNTWSALTLQFDLCYLFMVFPTREGSKRKHGSFLVYFFPHSFLRRQADEYMLLTPFATYSTRPKLTLAPVGLSSTFLKLDREHDGVENRCGPADEFILTWAAHTRIHSHTLVRHTCPCQPGRWGVT